MKKNKIRKYKRKIPDTILQQDIFKTQHKNTSRMTLEDDFFTGIEEQMSEGEWSQQAGMGDGDGTFTDRNNYKGQGASYKLWLKDREPIQFLADLYGASVSLIHSENYKRKDLYVVVLYGVRAIHFMIKVCPYLIEKRKKVTSLINYKFPEYTPPKVPMHLGNLSLMMGYTIGFFDSEGCIMFNKKKLKSGNIHYDRRVFFTNTDIRPLKKIQRFLTTKPFNYKTVSITSYKKEGNKRKYVLYVGTKHHASFLAIHEPIFQIERKRKKIEKFKMYHKISKICNERKKGGKCRNIS